MVKPSFISAMRQFMRFFYSLLYHPFAFTYDLVAWVVSFGRWNDWVRSVYPHLKGTRLLELGHGPGHLQRFLLNQGLTPVALDESTQMGRLAKRRLGGKQKLSRAVAQSLPFASASFDTVVATFPTEYIFDPKTLAEIRRVLADEGRLVILPATFPSNRFLKWLYKITGENPQQSLDAALIERFAKPFTQAKFQTEVKMITQYPNAILIVIIAIK